MSENVLSLSAARARKQEKARVLTALSSPTLSEDEAREALRLLLPVREAERRRGEKT